MSQSAPSSATAPDAALVKEALQWLVTLWSGEACAADRAACERWRLSDPRHEAAWRHVQSLDQRLGSLPAGIAGPALRAVRLRAKRRAVLGSLALAGSAGAIAWAVRDTRAWRNWTADYRTATGEFRSLVLADGSHVALNTATALDVRFAAHERRLRLHTGEIFIATAREASEVYRTFIVETARGTVQALGTRFTVRDSETRSEVAVFEGAIAVRPAGASQSTRVEAGQQTNFSATSAAQPCPVDPDAAAWTRRRLIVERMRLDTFLRELGRYRSGFLRCDPAVGDLRISGAFPLPDTERVLAALERVLPVRVHYTTRYWVTVGPR